MKTKRFRRSIAVLLALMMVFSLAPTGAFAAEENITVDVIVAQYGHDDWEILYPEDENTSTSVTVSGNPPTLLDAIYELDPSATLDTHGSIDLFFGLKSNWATTIWWCAINDEKVYDYNTQLQSDNKIIISYYDLLSVPAVPKWNMLANLLETDTGAEPEPTTPEEQLQNLIEAECSWDQIKGANAAMDAITTDLGSFPTSLGFYDLKLSWSTNGSPYMSDGGKITQRPNLGENPVLVTLTLFVENGLMHTGQYGDYPSPTRVKDYELKLSPLSQDEVDIHKGSVQAALDGITLETLKLTDGESLVPTDVQYDIQLVDPRDYGSRDTAYVPMPWSSNNPDVIAVNYLRGKVTRPAVGEPDATINLTVYAAKGGYQDSKTFTVTVKAVTQDEINEACTGLAAVTEALTFDVIKRNNASPDAVTSDLDMVYRGLGNPDSISWGTSNSGEEGVKIEWETSDTGTVKSYGTVTRPSATDRPVALTARLTPFRLAAYVDPVTVEIPIVVRKISNSAEVRGISLSPSLGFEFNAETKSYNLTAPALLNSVAVTVTAAESGTLITSGEHSAYGTLIFDLALNTSQAAAVSIKTEALDSEEARTYTLNIDRAAAGDIDREVATLLSSIADSYRNTAGDWEALALAAYGRASDVAGADIINNARDAYTDGSTAEIAKKIITLTALGVDAANVYSGNEGEYLDYIQKLRDKAPSMVNDATFALVAIDSGAYVKDDTGTRQSYINHLLEMKQKQAEGQYAWSWDGASSHIEVDTTAMVVAALAPYYLDDTLLPQKNDDIKAAVDGALAWLAAQQKETGHHGSSNSTATVIVACTALGIDPGAKTGDFTKAGNSLIDGILAFATDTNRFGFDNNISENAYGTEQAFRALVAYYGYLGAGKNAYNIYHFGPQTGDGTALTGEADPGVTPPDPNAPRNITVRVEDLYHGKTLMPETAVQLSGTHLDALKAALVANGKNPDTDLIESNGYVTDILGVDQDLSANLGWMYAVNGEIPGGLDQANVTEGDSLVLFYTNYTDSFYFTIFDRTEANIKAGESLTLTLTGLDPMDAMENGATYEALAGSTVFARDAAGRETGISGTTDANGKVTLTFPGEGTYTVSALRAGGTNQTDLVPPLCRVTVTSSAGGNPDRELKVHFTLQGLNQNSDNIETWLSRTITMANGATVSDVIFEALRQAGYTPGFGSGGYLNSITTPGGFKLAEMHKGLSKSGWLYTVNSQMPSVGMDTHTVADGDHILLYFTKDYTKDPDAGMIPDGEKTPEGTGEIKITPVVKDDIAVAAVDSGLIKEALDKLKNVDAKETRELKVEVAAVPGTSTSRVELKAGDVKAIAKAENVRLTITSANAALTFDAQTLAGMTKGVADNVTVAVTIAAVDTAKVDAERQTIIGSAPAVFDLGVMIGNTEAHELDGTATVFLPYVPAAGTDPAQLTVHHLGADFKVTPLKDAHYDAARGGFTFTTTHLSLFFIAEATDTVVDEEWHNPFTDVQEKDWFFDVVKYININQLMAGATADEFSPRAPMTRAMLVTVLHRYEGEPTAAAADSFTDVGANAWYGNAVAWAAENGIVAGYGNHLFGTHDNVTREQMAAILCNYSARKGLDVSQTANLSAYTDADAVSPWAREAVGWAAASGLIQGRSAETLAPKGTATRAEAGAILMRYIEGNAA